MRLRVLSLLVAIFILSPSRLWSEERDILDSIKGHELGHGVVDPHSHQLIPAKYSDPRLARAEQDLSDVQRPWTVPKMISIFKTEPKEFARRSWALQQQGASGTAEMERRWSDRYESLTRVLAASRDPRAAVALGDTLDKWSPEQVSAIMALFDYFVWDMYYGLPPDDKSRNWQTGNALEFIIPATTRWWSDNKTKLRKEAAALENHG